MIGLASFVSTLFTLYMLILIARTFLPVLGVSPYNPVAQWIYRLTEPILAPIRARLPPTGMYDWSPMVVFVGLIVLRQIVISLILSF